MNLSDKMLDLIGIAIGALGVGVGSGVTAFFLWLTNHNKSKAEAKKALAEADAEKVDAEADAKKTAAQTSQILTEAAMTSALKSNVWLSRRLGELDDENTALHKENDELRNRIIALENRVQDTERARDVAVAKFVELQQKYEIFKASILKLFEDMIAEISKLEAPLVDTVKVIEIIKAAKEKLPKTGPLG
jgi:chromosome segregation ATPase